MKVILKEYVYLHGVAGDVVDIADGFARNFLIPRGKAVKATPRALERNIELLSKVTERRKELTSRLIEVSNQIDGVELVFGRKAGRNNKLYGSVTTMDIANALLEETGIDIDRRRVSERSLRELGTFNIPIRMSAELAPVVKVVILPEEDVKEYLSKRDGGNEEAAEEMLASFEAEEPTVLETVETSAEETLIGESTQVLDVDSDDVEA
jgi:large subunit ribosomal protein L9